MTPPRLIFLAGPNGAGKSTYYAHFLQGLGLKFVNADRITAELDIPNTEAAAVADGIRSDLIEQQISFITETVFSDPVGAKLQFLRDAVAAGYAVTLIYVGLVSPELSAARVSQRVGQGGHDVPPDRLVRRFEQSLKNLVAALEFVPEVYVFDNSSTDTPYRLVLKSVGRLLETFEPVPVWLANALK